MWTSIRKIADAIYNDLVSGLRGYHQNVSISIEQLEQEVVETRLLVLKEYMLKGILPIEDLSLSLNCIPIDCKGLNKCPCNRDSCGSDPIAHFEIPQILFDYGLNKSILYLGSPDRQHPFSIYNSPLSQTYHKYRKRGKNKPWVYIDVTPNSRGYLDCYIFNSYLLKSISITAIFKDPRQLVSFQCQCEKGENHQDENLNFIDTVVKERLLKQKFFYYRQVAKPLEPNDQTYTTG